MEIFSKRREKISKLMKDNEALILFGEQMPAGISRFKQNNNFLYLTGLEIPDAKLLMIKIKSKVHTFVFIEENIPERIVWDGEKMRPKEAKEISSIENIKFVHQFESFLPFYLQNISNIYINYGANSLDSKLNNQLIFIEKLKRFYPHLNFTEFNQLAKVIRPIKSDWEIKQMQKAIDVTGKGIHKIMLNAKAGMMEYQLEAILQHEMLDNGLRYYGFVPIVAAGQNAATLHYIDNNTVIGENELVLLDVGASCNNYSADISRTFPIAEKFSQRQKEVYEKVLAVQKEIISMIKPGVGMKDLNKRTTELIIAALKDLNLIKEDDEHKKYYMHSVGHHLGMDTHDLGERDSVLEVGNVITIEPGIYIKEEKIGVRIEDDILITESGHKNLSESIPKEIEDIERIRKEALQG